MMSSFLSIRTQECVNCKNFHPLQTCKEFQASEATKKLAEGFNEAANVQFSAGRYEEALRLYSQAILKDPSEAKYFGNRCEALMRLHRYDDAYYDALKAIELNKSYSKIYDLAVRCCLIIGEIQGAEKIIQTFKSFHRGDPSFDEHTAKLEALKKLLNTATQLYKISDYAKCIETIEKCLEISPRYLALVQLKASCLEVTNRLKEALKLREKILSTDPHNAQFMRDKGIVLHRLGKLHEAMQVLDAAAKRDPNESEAVKERRMKIFMVLQKVGFGQECLLTGRFDEAVQVFTEVISLDPGNTEFNQNLHEHRGEANFNLRYFAAACVDFSEALKSDRQNARALYLRACCHHAMGQFEDCLTDCQNSLKIKWQQQTQDLYQEVFNILKSEKKCPYKTLGVPENATIEEIKIAYHNLTLQYHPSQNRKVTEEERKKIEGKFDEIVKAYVKLNQPGTSLSTSNQQFSSRHTLKQLSKDQIQRLERERESLNDQSETRKEAKRKLKSKNECSIM